MFAAGIVLWELASGKRLYKAAEGRESLIDQARRGDVPELPERGLPDNDRLRAIAGKALAHDRAQRYVSAAAMLRDLEEYAASARLMTSPLQLGDWLEKTFGEEIVATRRARERAAAALEKGPPLVLEAIPTRALAAAPTEALESVPPSVDTYRIDVEPLSARVLPGPPASVPTPFPPAVLTKKDAGRAGVPHLAEVPRLAFLLGVVVFLALAVVAGIVALALRAR